MVQRRRWANPFFGRAETRPTQTTSYSVGPMNVAEETITTEPCLVAPVDLQHSPRDSMWCNVSQWTRRRRMMGIMVAMVGTVVTFGVMILLVANQETHTHFQMPQLNVFSMNANQTGTAADPVAASKATSRLALPPSLLERARSNNRRSRSRRVEDTVQHRTVLVVRMLDQAEDEEAETNARNQLNQVLFEGGTLSADDTAAIGGDVGGGTTVYYPSVRQQLWDCSGGTVQLDSLGVTSVVVNSVPPELLAERNAWVEATAALVMQPGSAFVEMASPSSGSNSGSSATTGATPYFDEDATNRMRQSADHVILVLPPSYPDESFLAHAEVNHSISVFSHTWTISLSAFLHELGHNIMLRHAGGVQEGELYGDTTGYMGRSTFERGSPRKCYNAAQHWIMGWYNGHRLSLLAEQDTMEEDTDLGPVRIDVAAFVDHTKLNDDSNGMVVLVQLDADTYLHFNRAKEYNADTGMMADEVVIVRDNGNSTRLLVGLNDKGETTYQYKSTTTLKIVTIQVCRIVIHPPTTDNTAPQPVDYAIVAVDRRQPDSDVRDSERDVVEFCRKLRKERPDKDSQEEETPSSPGLHFTVSPTPSPVSALTNDEPTGFDFNPFDDADIVPTASPATTTTSPNATAVTTKMGNLRSKAKQLINKASNNPEAVYAGMAATAVVGLFLLGCCCGCWCCCRRRRRKRKAVAAAKNDESTIASFFSSVKLY